MQERARTAPMPIDSPRREEQDREGNPSDSSVPITKPMLGRKWDGEGEKEGRRWDGYKEVLKVNRIAATESYCRGGKSRRRRHWIRRAGAIYSIHGRTNTNLRLDVQTASSLPIPCFFSRLLSPIHDFSLFFHFLLSLFSSSMSTFFPRCLVSTLSFFHGPSLLSLDRSPSFRRRIPRQLVICHSNLNMIHPSCSCTYIEGERGVPDQRDRVCGLPPRQGSVDVESDRELLSDLWRNRHLSRSTCVLPLSIVFLSSSSPSSCAGSGFWSFGSRQPLLRHGINLVSRDRYLPAPSRSNLFATNGRSILKNPPDR